MALELAVNDWASGTRIHVVIRRSELDIAGTGTSTTTSCSA